MSSVSLQDLNNYKITHNIINPVINTIPLIQRAYDTCILGIVVFYKVSRLYSAFNTLAYVSVSVLASFLWYMNPDDFKFSFGLILFPSLGITCTGSFYSGSDVGILSSSISVTKSFLCVPRTILGVSSGSFNFPFFPIIILFLDDTLGIRLLQLVCIFFVVVRVSYHYGLVHLVYDLLFSFSPFIDVGDMSVSNH